MSTNTSSLTGRKAIGISFATQYVELVIQFASVMALARILSPSEIGTFSIAAMLMTMLHVFRDFGVIQYIIQERDLTREKLQAVMGVAILLALTVAAVLFGLSGPVARFYANPALVDVLLVMSASFAVSPFGSVVLGVLRRDGRLDAIFYVKTFSALCHVTVAVSMALNGYGALSLAWANFAGILAFGIGGNLFRPKHFPWLPRFRNIGTVLSFGSISSLGNLANIAGSSAPELIVGKVMNMAAVGYFSRATGLVQLFTHLVANAVTPLVLPYFSQMQREGQKLDKPYLMAVGNLTAVAWPFLSVLLVLAYPVTHALYGPQWDPSVPLARTLCVAGALAAIGLFASPAMVAAGHVRSATACNLLVQPVRILAVLASSAYGLQAVALALVASECIGVVAACWFLNRTIGVRPLGLLRACGASVVIALCSVAVPVLVWLGGADTQANAWGALALGGGGAALGWLGGLVLTRHPLGEHVLPLLRLRRGATAQASASPATPAAAAAPFLAPGAWDQLGEHGNLTVAMFQRVGPESATTPESLAHCLEFFSHHYRVVSAAQVADALEGKASLQPDSLLIAFDQDWADSTAYAQPVLDRYRLPALVFVAGSATGQAGPIREEGLCSFLATGSEGGAQIAKALAQLAIAPLACVERRRLQLAS